MPRPSPALRPLCAAALLALLVLGSWAPAHEIEGPHGVDHGVVFVVDHEHPEAAAHFETATRREGSLCLACLLRSRSLDLEPGIAATAGAFPETAAGPSSPVAAPQGRAVRGSGARAPPLG